MLVLYCVCACKLLLPARWMIRCTPKPQLLQVPWGGKQVALGMLAWAASFLLVGLVVSPLVVKSAGVTVGAPSAYSRGFKASVWCCPCDLTWRKMRGFTSLLECESCCWRLHQSVSQERAYCCLPSLSLPCRAVFVAFGTLTALASATIYTLLRQSVGAQNIASLTATDKSLLVLGNQVRSCKL